MLNIISRSIQNKKIRGPKKVVNNLILGLEKMNYPYVINKDLNSCERLWIHDDIDALYDLKNINKDIGVIIGPNLFVNPENIPNSINLSKTVYIQPSINVKNIWEKRGYNKSSIEVWSVGIDTEKYTPFGDKKDTVLIYFKNRTKEELEQIESVLKNKNLTYKIIAYNSYREEDYYPLLKKIKYIIWLGIYESQGIALEEALSCNIPMIILDTQVLKNEFDINSSSAPYFDKRCGIIVKDIQKLKSSVDIMEQTYPTFNPREFILENLELKKQAEKFIDLYKKYFQLKKDDDSKEKCDNTKNYKISTITRIWHKICRKIFHD